MIFWRAALTLALSFTLLAEAPQQTSLKDAFDAASAEHYGRACTAFHEFYSAYPRYADVGAIDQKALDAMRKVLSPADVMHDIDNLSDPSVTPAQLCTGAFTAYVLYLHDGDRVGSVESSALGRREYEASLAAAPAAPPSGEVSSLVPGRYACSTFGGSIELHGNGSTFSGGLSAGGTISISGNRYAFGVGEDAQAYRGRYTVEPSTKRVRFDGILAHAFARLSNPSTDGVPSISFPYEQNRAAIDGHRLAGGPMSCYHQHTP